MDKVGTTANEPTYFDIDLCVVIVTLYGSSLVFVVWLYIVIGAKVLYEVAAN